MVEKLFLRSNVEPLHNCDLFDYCGHWSEAHKTGWQIMANILLKQYLKGFLREYILINCTFCLVYSKTARKRDAEKEGDESLGSTE